MFGCHNCSYQIKPGTQYEKTPCANCRTRKNPPAISYYQDDPATFDTLRVEHPAYQQEEDEMEARTHEIMRAFARTLEHLMELREKHPASYQFVYAKILHPEKSYREIAELYDCKKQNVLYHLRRAVQFFPDLEFALLVDTRFSAGRHALRETGKLGRMSDNISKMRNENQEEQNVNAD